MNKTDLQILVEIRVKEATVLLENECYQGAYYLLGYALDCAFKACITKQVRENDFPNKQLANTSHTHNAITSDQSGASIEGEAYWSLSNLPLIG